MGHKDGGALAMWVHGHARDQHTAAMVEEVSLTERRGNVRQRAWLTWIATEVRIRSDHRASDGRRRFPTRVRNPARTTTYPTSDVGDSGWQPGREILGCRHRRQPALKPAMSTEYECETLLSHNSTDTPRGSRSGGITRGVTS